MFLFTLNTNVYNMDYQSDHGLALEDSCALIITL